ncbi:MAG TPA: hypothetical protein EYM47_03315 [Candidatus Marinimicrobia bacterium]|nr:hypothetical protein [Candidatus Neomarinimicrobiota bacterium]
MKSSCSYSFAKQFPSSKDDNQTFHVLVSHCGVEQAQLVREFVDLGVQYSFHYSIQAEFGERWGVPAQNYTMILL